MIQTDVEILYEDDDIIIVRVMWKIGDRHGQKIIERRKEHP